MRLNFASPYNTGIPSTQPAPPPPLSVLEIAARAAAAADAASANGGFQPRSRQLAATDDWRNQNAYTDVVAGEPTSAPPMELFMPKLDSQAEPRMDSRGFPEYLKPAEKLALPVVEDASDVLTRSLGPDTSKTVGQLQGEVNARFRMPPQGSNASAIADGAMAQGRAQGQSQILNDPRLRQQAFANTGGLIKGGPTDPSLDAEAARAAQRRAAQVAITTPAAPMGPVAAPASAPVGHFAGPRGQGDDTAMAAMWLDALGPNANPEVPVAVLNPEIPLPGAEPQTKEGAQALRHLAMRAQIKKINDMKQAQAALPINQQTSMPIMSILPKPGAVQATASPGAPAGAAVPSDFPADRVAALIGQKPTAILNKAGLTGNQQLAVDQENAWDKFRQDRRDRTSGLQRWQNDAARANWQLARDRTNVESDRVNAQIAAAAAANALQGKQLEAQNNIALAGLAQQGKQFDAAQASQKEGMLYQRRQAALKMLSDAQAAVVNAEREASDAERLSGGLENSPEGIAAAQKRSFANALKSQLQVISKNLEADLGLPAMGVTDPRQAAPAGSAVIPNAVDNALGTTPATPVQRQLSPQDQAIKAQVESHGGRYSDPVAASQQQGRLSPAHGNIILRIGKLPGSVEAKAKAYFELNPEPSPEEFADLARYVGISAAREARVAAVEARQPEGIFYTDDPNRAPWIRPPSIFGRGANDLHWVNPPGY